MPGSKSSHPTDVPQPDTFDQPLGLTVHTLPALGAVAHDSARRAGGGRWRMLAVLVICAAPVVASYFTYYVIRPEGRRNFGELIDPQRPLPAVQSVSLEGKQDRLTSLRGQWLLISVAGGACDSVCEHHLYLQRQLRESLGKEKERMDWVWLVDDGAPVRPELLPAIKTATVLRVDSAQLSKWLEPAAGHQLVEHLYMVDPLGNWMMRFPAGMDKAAAPQAKRDLERLMRASASWDEPGR